jgi:orotate phosphoribosyltransferase
MTSEEALGLFRQTGALLEGHFLLRSGLHSRQFFQCALALQRMPIVEKFGAALAARVAELGVETVVAPAMGGLVIGQEVARQLGCRFIFAEKEEGRLVLRRGFTLRPGERCLVVEDVVTTGGSSLLAIDRAIEFGLVVERLVTVIDRLAGGREALAARGIPLDSLVTIRDLGIDPDAG